MSRSERTGRSWRTRSGGLLLAVLVASAPASAISAQVRLDLPGIVLDTKTGRGVPDAVVRVLGTSSSAVSGANGTFLLRRVPVGTWTVAVEHVAYAESLNTVTLADGVDVRIEIRIAPEAIELAPITVEGESALAREQRTTGASFWEVTQEEIVRAIHTSRHLGDLIRQTVPGLKVRQSNSLAGNDVCLEFRAAASISLTLARACNHPLVLLDGVPVSNPQSLYGTLPLEDLHRLQMIPPGEAGARYGSGALYGVLLIETQRPGRDPLLGPVDAVGVAPRPRMTFDWSQEPGGHPTGRTALGAALGNAVGLALGLGVARRCLEVTSRDALDSTCGTGTAVASGAAAFVFPALGSALGARLGGATDASVGRLLPALLGAGMALFPGYAFTVSSASGKSRAVDAAGAAFLVLGVPLAATLADRLFRDLR